MENLNAEQIVIEIQGLIKALKANNGWWENRGRGGWFNHDILVDAVAVITSQEQRIKELTEENERLKSEVSVKRKLLNKAEVRIDCLDEVNKVLQADICNAAMSLEHITKENERLKADTVREMQELIYERLDISVEGYSSEEIKSDVRDMVYQIAKEMLEGEK